VKLLSLLLVSLVASISFAEQGLVLRFAIEKNDASDITQRYENAVLVSFNEEHSFQIPDLYELKVFAENTDTNTANVRFEYSDIQNDNVEFIDQYNGQILIDGTASQTMNNAGTEYQLTLWATYGELP
jgi:Fe-S cluster assembly iron-binding protein IscA